MEGVTSPSKMKHFLKIALINKIFKDGLLLEVSNKRFFSRKSDNKKSHGSFREKTVRGIPTT